MGQSVIEVVTATRRGLWLPARVSMLLLLAAFACVETPDTGLFPAAFEATDSATLVAPGIVSTAAPEFAAAFTSDGSRLYFNRASSDRQEIMLLESHFAAGQWSEPQPAPFSGDHRDLDPFVTPDGSRLYFSSTRPRSEGREPGDFNTWYVQLTPDGWSEPVALEPPLNTESQEVFVSLDGAHNIFFASDRDGVQRIYRSRWMDGSYEPPELLQFDMNQQDGVGNPLVTPDGRMLIFVSDRVGGHGGADLYATCQLGGVWSPAVNLGPRVNSAYADFAPALTADGQHLVFTSERPGLVSALPPDVRPPGDLYYVRLADLDSPCE
jgi:Tol biopolymer transport system component